MAFKVALLVLMTSVATAVGLVYECFRDGEGSAKSLCASSISDFCGIASKTTGLGIGETITRCATAKAGVMCDFRVVNSGPVVTTPIVETQCTAVLNDIVNNCDKGGTGRFSSDDPVDPIMFSVDPNARSTC